MRPSRPDQSPGGSTRRAASLALLALLCAVPLAARAQDAADVARAPAAGAAADLAPVPWSSLSSGQQKLLQRFEGQWDTLPVPRQNALALGSERDHVPSLEGFLHRLERGGAGALRACR